MQREDRVPQPMEPLEPVMPPRGASHLVHSLNTTEELRLPGSGQRLASWSRRCSRHPQSAPTAREGHGPLLGSPRPQADPLPPEVRTAPALAGGAPRLGERVQGEDGGQTYSRGSQSPQNRETRVAGPGGHWRSVLGYGIHQGSFSERRSPGHSVGLVFLLRSLFFSKAQNFKGGSALRSPCRCVSLYPFSLGSASLPLLPLLHFLLLPRLPDICPFNLRLGPNFSTLLLFCAFLSLNLSLFFSLIIPSL